MLSFLGFGKTKYRNSNAGSHINNSQTHATIPPAAPTPVKDATSEGTHIEEVDDTSQIVPIVPIQVVMDTDASAQNDGFANAEEKRETLEDKSESDLIQTHNKAAIAHLGSNDLAGAVIALRKVIACKERDDDFGVDHQSTLSSVSQLARLHMRMGDYASAETLHKRVLETYFKNGNTTGALTTMNSVALSLMRQGKLAEAEDYFQQIVSGKEELGVEEIQVRSAYNNMGYINCFQEKFEDAKTFFQKSSDIEQRNPDIDVKVKADDNISAIGTMTNQ